MSSDPIWSREFVAPHYQLAATLDSGQAFRWERVGEAWEGVVGRRWLRLCSRAEGGVRAWAAADPGDWRWLEDYLGLRDDLEAVVKTFPSRDRALTSAVSACWGLRLLRQEPWECLASFILSSTKQIVQIRRIVGSLCHRFGDPVPAPAPSGEVRSFPTAAQIASLSEAALRQCGMGFRAPYLLQTARRVASGEMELGRLRQLSLAEAREVLMTLPGVGRKIADCVLLFSCGFRAAFPVDVWILRVLRELYFADRAATPRELVTFAETNFGPEGGYAQQYLFHWIRMRAGRIASTGGIRQAPGRDGD